MLNSWKKLTALSAALGLILLGSAGIILPLIPGFVLIIAGAILADKVAPELKHHPRLKPLIEKIKNIFSRKN